MDYTNKLIKSIKKYDHEELESILRKIDGKQVKLNMNWVLGTAESYMNIRAVSSLNLFIRENNISIQQMEVIKSIYETDCSRCEIPDGWCVTWSDFDGEIKREYCTKYGKIFDKKYKTDAIEYTNNYNNDDLYLMFNEE